jgi:hypothetical protein
MPASNAALNMASRWQPVSECFAKVRTEFSGLANCAESVLGEVEAIHRELVERARDLAHLEQRLADREAQLTEQRTERARLMSQFEQQEAHLRDAVEEVRRLREELALREPPQSLAADSARLVLEEARQTWDRERSEVLERLNALTLMQQTGTSDSSAITAFCQELSEIREIVEGSRQETRDVLATNRNELLGQMAAIAKSSEPATDSLSHFDDLRGQLQELAGQVAAWQRESRDNTAREELLQRLDELRAAQQTVPEDSPLLDLILQQLTETRSLVEGVRSAADVEAPDYDAMIHELRSELSEMRIATEKVVEHSASSAAEKETAAQLRAETQLLRRLADAAREQAQRQEQERALVEAELDRLRTQSAQWRHDLEQEMVRHQEEERLWRDELQELRQTVQQAARSMADSSVPSTVAGPERPGEKVSGDPPPPPADAVSNSLMAQFAKLQKDSARRRTRGSNS